MDQVQSTEFKRIEQVLSCKMKAWPQFSVHLWQTLIRTSADNFGGSQENDWVTDQMPG